jgi:hypothetical protein
MSSPYPPEECLQRLGKVASARGAGWYLDPKATGMPDPRLRGDIGQSGIHVARFRDTMGRNSFVPWLDARIEPGFGGGAVLTGTIGPWPGSAGFASAMIVIFSFMALAGVVAGTAALAVSGSIRVLPVLLIPFGIGVIGIIIIVFNGKKLSRHVLALVQEVNDILGSTARM